MTAPLHRLRVVSPPGDPAEAVVELDGQPLDFVSRIELVLDADTSEATVRLSVPAAVLDLDMDAQAFVTAHAAQNEAMSEQPTAAEPCTATFLDVRGNLRRCTQTASHYDATLEPVWNTPLGPPEPGGWHSDGEATWIDTAHGATPHGEQADLGDAKSGPTTVRR